MAVAGTGGGDDVGFFGFQFFLSGKTVRGQVGNRQNKERTGSRRAGLGFFEFFWGDGKIFGDGRRGGGRRWWWLVPSAANFQLDTYFRHGLSAEKYLPALVFLSFFLSFFAKSDDVSGLECAFRRCIWPLCLATVRSRHIHLSRISRRSLSYIFIDNAITHLLLNGKITIPLSVSTRPIIKAALWTRAFCG